MALVVLGGLWPRTATAQQWYELYADAQAAFQDGKHGEAAELFRRAIEERREPGTLVPTYGTNFEPRYFPYLRLAEAHLLAGADEKASQALQASARFGIAPVEERSALEARVHASIESKRPPPTPADPAPTPEPTAQPRAASAIEVPTPAARSTPDAPAPAPESPTGPTEERPAPPTPEPTRRPEPRNTPAPETRSAAKQRPQSTRTALDVTSDPPGAQVFVDDEPVGRTDPETGRLSLRTLAAGRHRLRLSAPGHDDFIREVQIAQGTVSVDARLPPRPVASATAAPERTASPRPTVSAGPLIGLAVGLIVVIGLLVRSVGHKSPEPSAGDATPVAGPLQDRGTDEIFPMEFGGYSLVRRIGKGGMAVVYEAVRQGETLALKRPLTGFLDDDRFRERFVREAELGRTLHHPNIIRIVDRGQVGEAPYFAMELIRGETLAARMDREGRLDPRVAARLTSQVAEALDYAHSKGVIHRDLKPSNIMIDPSGGVKVMDYGIARAQHLDGLTTTGAFLGTPSYVAPETVESASQPSSDIYSLGVVFFEMLTGSVPFRGDTAFAVLRQHCTTPPPIPSSLNYSLPPQLDKLVLQLLSKVPAERPTAEELLNRLVDFLAEER